MNQTSVNIFIPKEFKELFNPVWRNLAYYGGRGSAKSHSVARALVIRGRKEKLRIYCLREVQNSIEDSSFQLIKDIIELYNLTDYTYTTKEIINNITGTTFSFKGLRKGTTDSVKSLEGIDVAWVEEAQSVTKDSLEILSPTVRKQGSQLIFTFNRMTELDPVYVKYVMNPPEDTFSLKVNYDVAMRCGIFPESLKKEMEYDKATDPILYAHKWLGEPIGQAEMSIIARSDVLDAMSRDIDSDGQIVVGVDVARMGNDRTVFWKRKGLKTIETKIYPKNTIDEAATYLEQFVGFNKEIEIKIDDTGVGGGLTDIMKSKGYNVIPINFGENASDTDKYTNLISEAWFYLANNMNEIQLPQDNDLLQELSTRQWKMDSKGRRAVESKGDYKKRGYKSPDLADACIICYYTPNIFIIGEDDVSFI